MPTGMMRFTMPLSRLISSMRSMVPPLMLLQDVIDPGFPSVRKTTIDGFGLEERPGHVGQSTWSEAIFIDQPVHVPPLLNTADDIAYVTAAFDVWSFKSNVSVDRDANSTIAICASVAPVPTWYFATMSFMKSMLL
jgi:hypothetical protein